jgi:hypothetical protein
MELKKANPEIFLSKTKMGDISMGKFGQELFILLTFSILKLKNIGWIC